MKNLKKLFSVFLCFAVALSCSLVLGAAPQITTVYGKDAYGLTNALGITDKVGETDLSSPLTRGEFYTILAKTAGYPEIKNTNPVFAYYAPGAEGAGYAKALYKVGVLSPDASGKLYPEATIGAGEASALLLKVLGYGPKAEAMGGYPGGYLALAASTDLDDEVNMSSKSLTRGEAIQLVYNALHTDMMLQTVSVSGNKTEYKVSPDTTLLNTVFGIELIEGVVNGVDISRLAGPNDIKPFHMEVDGYTLEARAVSDPYSYLGYDVKAYYTDSRLFGPKIVYMEKSDLNEEVVVNTEDITAHSSGKIKGYDESTDKYKNYSYITSVPVIYNGVATGQAFSENIYKDKLGSLRLLDNTGDGKADVVFVDVYENYVVSHVDLNDLVMYNKYNLSEKLTIDLEVDEPYVLIFDEEGKSANSSDIKAGCVVSVYHSASDAYQQYVRLFVSNKVAVGEIEEISDNGNEITIEGNTYKLNSGVKPYMEGYLNPGTGIRLLLDQKGEVAGFEPDATSEMTYGYLVGGAASSGLEGGIEFRIYSTEGEFTEYPAAKNIRIDDVRYSANDEAMLVNIYRASHLVNGIEDAFSDMEGIDAAEAYAGADAPMGSVVRYSVNTNGEIKAIDTVMHTSKELAKREGDKTTNNALFFAKSDATTDYMRRSGTYQWSLGPKIAMTNTAKIIIYPDPAGEDRFSDESFESGTVSQYLNHDSRYEAYAFYTDDINLYSEFLAMNGNVSDGKISESAKVAIVDHISKIVDPVKGEGEIDCLNVIYNGSVTKLPVKDGFLVSGTKDVYDLSEDLPVTALKKGDVIRYRKDSSGYVQAMNLYYSIELDKYSSVSDRGAQFRHYFSLRDGYVYKSYNDGYLVYFGDEKDISEVTADDCEFVVLTGASPNFYNYEKGEDGIVRITTGSVSDIKSYIATGSDYSHILLQSYYGTPYAIVNIDNN